MRGYHLLTLTIQPGPESLRGQAEHDARAGPQARVAESVALVHPRPCGLIEDKRVAMHEQHGYPAVAKRGGVRFLQGCSHAGQGSASQGHVGDLHVTFSCSPGPSI